MKTTSEHAIRQLRRTVRAARATYCQARKAALGLTGPRAYSVRGDKLSAAVEARYWYYIYLRRLAALLETPIEPHGGRVSPNALQRLRDTGRLR